LRLAGGFGRKPNILPLKKLAPAGLQALLLQAEIRAATYFDL
jgi:hypothetical protein